MFSVMYTQREHTSRSVDHYFESPSYSKGDYHSKCDTFLLSSKASVYWTLLKNCM